MSEKKRLDLRVKALENLMEIQDEAYNTQEKLMNELATHFRKRMEALEEEVRTLKYGSRQSVVELASLNHFLGQHIQTTGWNRVKNWTRTLFKKPELTPELTPLGEEIAAPKFGTRTFQPGPELDPNSKNGKA